MPLANAFIVIATACQSNSSAPFPVVTLAMKRKSPLSLYPRRAYPLTMVSTCWGMYASGGSFCATSERSARSASSRCSALAHAFTTSAMDCGSSMYVIWRTTPAMRLKRRTSLMSAFAHDCITVLTDWASKSKGSSPTAISESCLKSPRSVYPTLTSAPTLLARLVGSKRDGSVCRRACVMCRSSFWSMSRPCSFPYAFRMFATACKSNDFAGRARAAEAAKERSASSRMLILAIALTAIARCRERNASGGSDCATEERKCTVATSCSPWRAIALRMFTTACGQKSPRGIPRVVSAIMANSRASCTRIFAKAFRMTDTDCALNCPGSDAARLHAMAESAAKSRSSRMRARAKPLRVTERAWASKPRSSCAASTSTRAAHARSSGLWLGDSAIALTVSESSFPDSVSTCARTTSPKNASSPLSLATSLRSPPAWRCRRFRRFIAPTAFGSATSVPCTSSSASTTSESLQYAEIFRGSHAV
mmetsp:Transcript_18376/g.41353  ORF Transcript_18376/g.41353 Transcript_18376/m.41353 type:complete len:479 (-) Transcript_18376:754-2190(-)